MSEYIVEVSEWVIDVNGNPPFGKGNEIVRCRDCAKWATEKRFTGGCIGPKGDADPNGFCAWGERKVVEE